MNPVQHLATRVILGAAALFVSVPASAAVDLDQSNEAAFFQQLEFGADFVGQTIVIGKTGVLDSIDFAISATDGSTSGDVTVQIRGVDPNLTLITEKTFFNFPIEPDVDGFVRFDVASMNFAVTQDQNLVVVVTSTNHSGSPYLLELSLENYSDGGPVASADAANWTAFAFRDARFRTYVADAVEVVAVDVKPGSDSNCLKVNGHGVIPVAILGSEAFDVTEIDPWSLTFGAMDVRVRGKKGPCVIAKTATLMDTTTWCVSSKTMPACGSRMPMTRRP